MFSINAIDRFRRSESNQQKHFDILVGKVISMTMAQTADENSGISKIQSMEFYIKGKNNDNKYMRSSLANEFLYRKLDTEHDKLANFAILC